MLQDAVLSESLKNVRKATEWGLEAKMSDDSKKKPPDLVIRGFEIFEGFLDEERQRSLLEDLRKLVARAPLFVPTTSRGQEMSVRMTSAGRFGWAIVPCDGAGPACSGVGGESQCFAGQGGGMEGACDQVAAEVEL